MRLCGETGIVYQTERPSGMTAWCVSSTRRLTGNRMGFASAAARSRAATAPMSFTRVQLKLESMDGRMRVEAALARGVADRPPVGAWGHTYKEGDTPEAAKSITVERDRRFGCVV